MSTMYTVVLQAAAASNHGSDHMVHLRRAASTSVGSESKGDQLFAATRSHSSVAQQEKASGPSLKGLVTEYFGPGQRLREIYLRSREGERVAVPITLAVQLSPRLRDFVDTVMVEGATRGRDEFYDRSRQSLDVPCSGDVLRLAVEFLTAKLELELKLSEDGIRMNEEQKKEHWRDFLYYRIAWRTDLDDFADDILKVAEYLSIQSLYDLMKCCFRLRL